MKTYFTENFTSVDPGLTPDPFSSVTAGGGNTVAASATGGVSNGPSMLCTFAGVGANAFGQKVLAAISLSSGALFLLLKVNPQLLINGGNFANVCGLRSAGVNILEVRWVADTIDATTGVFWLWDTVAGVGVASMQVRASNTLHTMKVSIKKNGVCKLYFGGAVLPEATLTLAAPVSTINGFRIGCFSATLAPLVTSTLTYDDVILKQEINSGEFSTISDGSSFDMKTIPGFVVGAFDG